MTISRPQARLTDHLCFNSCQTPNLSVGGRRRLIQQYSRPFKSDMNNNRTGIKFTGMCKSHFIVYDLKTINYSRN